MVNERWYIYRSAIDSFIHWIHYNHLSLIIVLLYLILSLSSHTFTPLLLLSSSLCESNNKNMATKLKDGVFIGDAEASQDIDFLVSNKIQSVSYTHLTLPTICSV